MQFSICTQLLQICPRASSNLIKALSLVAPVSSPVPPVPLVSPVLSSWTGGTGGLERQDRSVVSGTLYEMLMSGVRLRCDAASVVKISAKRIKTGFFLVRRIVVKIFSNQHCPRNCNFLKSDCTTNQANSTRKAVEIRLFKRLWKA
jgi:hypothetical protein